MAAAVTASGDRPVKLAGYVPISTEAAADAAAVSLQIDVAMGVRPDPRTPEQQAAARAESERRRLERWLSVVEAQGRHRRYAAGEAGPVAAAVVGVHAPRPVPGRPDQVECAGCPEDREYGAHEWPCETWSTVDHAARGGTGG